MAINTRPTSMNLLPQNSRVETNECNALRPVLNSYSFKKHSIYYDAKAQSKSHFMAFVHLARLFETLGLSSFRCFSLRRSWSPGYVQSIQVVDLNANPFKAQEENKLLRFCGIIQTDRAGRFKTQEHQDVNGRCVAIDLGRRDLLFCVDEKATVEIPSNFGHTKQDQDRTRISKKYSNILQVICSNNPTVYQAENVLAENQNSSLNYYGYTTTFSQNPQLMLRKLRLAAYFNKQRADMQLINSLKQKFGKDAIFVLGSWSAPNALYHEPIRDMRLRRHLL
ncbi:uncharacterized protein EV154DRAFT_568744 [Mucor mucedo]|uniref:uncharacterized protein n=1 Tax=Mucor mucedo TaxID=29922 RepID=UPI00221F0C05|nr:uncharacterized protein EV154DRAFT_568744 [Mucor mucedo]KAI7879204.1 hypothetical protein EV154DRAFT_568744 [Mucor mucedo]